jgi:light-regulated signal transduction histidine kinase (bacteriophytochrome)
LPTGNEVFVQCPFGLSSYLVAIGPVTVALTGFVPFPRVGGAAEKSAAKHHPDLKVSRESVRLAAESLRAAQSQLDEIEHRAVKQQSMALHEIRKLNRTVKQTAERICRAESPADPDRATKEFVSIWKASELMSQQFEVIELLANESLATLPLRNECEPYRIFDKCARIYRDRWKDIYLWAPPGFSPRIAACDKTFPILASVLIENATKYAVPGTQIKIDFRPIYGMGGRFAIEVRNVAEPNAPLSRNILLKGVRGSSDGEGSGNGLYVADLVARQHGSELSLDVHSVSGIPGRVNVVFTVLLRPIDK